MKIKNMNGLAIQIVIIGNLPQILLKVVNLIWRILILLTRYLWLNSLLKTQQLNSDIENNQFKVSFQMENSNLL